MEKFTSRALFLGGVCIRRFIKQRATSKIYAGKSCQGHETRNFIAKSTMV